LSLWIFEVTRRSAFLASAPGCSARYFICSAAFSVTAECFDTRVYAICFARRGVRSRRSKRVPAVPRQVLASSPISPIAFRFTSDSTAGAGITTVMGTGNASDLWLGGATATD
jgi:hypothetical protein